MSAWSPAQDGHAPATRTCLTTHLHGEQLTIMLTEDIDHHTADALFIQAQAIVIATGARYVIINLAGLEFCDSAGVRVFIRLHQTAVDRGIALHLHHPRPHIRWLLQILDATYLLDHLAPHDARGCS